MTFKKRGLGRGLEALLAEDSVKEEKQPPSNDARQEEAPSTPVEQTAMVVAFFKGIQKEHRTLLEEAENLKKLIEEFEALVKQE